MVEINGSRKSFFALGHLAATFEDDSLADAEGRGLYVPAKHGGFMNFDSVFRSDIAVHFAA